MPVIYLQVLSLQNIKKVGAKECVALVQEFAPGIGPSSSWKEGECVLGNKDIVPGTAIATFVKGRYPSLRHGNHAAFFIEQAVNGFHGGAGKWTSAQCNTVRTIKKSSPKRALFQCITNALIKSRAPMLSAWCADV
jgi:hypothetical protein